MDSLLVPNAGKNPGTPEYGTSIAVDAKMIRNAMAEVV